MDEYTPKLTQAPMERKTGLFSVKDNPDGAFEIIETITIKMPRTRWRSVDETKIGIKHGII